MEAVNWTPEDLQEVFEIIDGKVFRKEYVDVCNRKQGGFVENVANANKGYCVVSFKGRRVKYHRILWILEKGPIPKGLVVDHKDGNPLNNCINNLRLLTVRENAQNTKFHRDGSLPGVYWDKRRGKWHAQIRVDDKQIFLGYFTTQLEAFDAYIQANVERGYPVWLCLELREKHIAKLQEMV